MRRMLAIAVALLGLSTATAQEPPAWSYPTCKVSATKPPTMLRVPGSTLRFSSAQIADRSVTSDWFPQEHEPMPLVLRKSRAAGLVACGYCHLSDGTGRPENAKIAGLPASYIVEQVHAIRAHERRPLREDWPPTKLMADSLQGLSEADLLLAADYYARQKPRSSLKVVEVSQVPAYAQACFVLRLTPGPTSSLGAAIVELPDDIERFEARDPHTTYTAYVPTGSLARGADLARGGRRTPSCATCHGSDLRSGPALPGPPIAGRFATYTFRQLLGIQRGSRSSSALAPMQAVLAELSQDDLIDLAAFVASLPP